MYTMVLMMAVTSSGDVSSFGHRSGCHGNQASCHGTVVGTSTGCTGVVVESASCNGGSVGGSCHGSRAGIFGLRGKLFGGKSCHGSSCHGNAPAPSGSCYGSGPTVVATPDCNACPTADAVITMPAAAPAAAPVAMPKAEDKPKSEEKPKDKPKSDDKPKQESN